MDLCYTYLNCIYIDASIVHILIQKRDSNVKSSIKIKPYRNNYEVTSIAIFTFNIL